MDSPMANEVAIKAGVDDPPNAVEAPDPTAADPGASADAMMEQEPATESFATPELAETAPAAMCSSIELLDDVELDVRIVLGRTEMYVEDVLRLGVGSVVELDKLAGDPVDIYVNEQLVARGEVLVLNENFCVRVNDILSPVPELDGK
jgi:flagellar motor switch protein FliN